MKRAENKRTIRAIDMFAGGGGSSWGAKQAGVKVVAAFDLWHLAEKNHEANFPDVRFYRDRLENLDLKKVRKEVGRIDLIMASPECTNHSPAKGNKPRSEESKDTAFQVTRFAEAFKPKWIVVENVVNMRKWSRYKEFQGKLEALGYKCTEQVLNAADFGVAQSRRRLFLLCQRGKKAPLKTHKPDLPKVSVRPIVNMNGAYRWTPLNQPRRAKATLERASRGFEKMGYNSAFLLVYYGSDGGGGWQRLSRPLRTITTVDRFAIVKPTPQGHVMRMLQVPELQQAMGMHGMCFEHGTRRDKIKMIGNAVCPPVMATVLRELTRNK
ncbi:MAG TPA: DNA cytosine methyltransferase [Flavobacteriales bacterium]